MGRSPAKTNPIVSHPTMYAEGNPSANTDHGGTKVLETRVDLSNHMT